MKIKYIQLIVLALIFFSDVQSQSRNQLKEDYQRDTLKGRNFGDFIKPKIAIKNYSFSEVDIVPTFFKECKGLNSNREKEKCFSEFFFEVLRKRMRIPSGLKDNRPIIIITQFTINELGEIEDIIIVETNDYTGKLKDIIFRILKKMPKIKPAMINNQFVKVIYKFPLKIQR